MDNAADNDYCNKCGRLLIRINCACGHDCGDAIRALERERVAGCLEARARMLSIISRAEKSRWLADELALIAKELRDNTLGRDKT